MSTVSLLQAQVLPLFRLATRHSGAPLLTPSLGERRTTSGDPSLDTTPSDWESRRTPYVSSRQRRRRRRFPEPSPEHQRIVQAEDRARNGARQQRHQERKEPQNHGRVDDGSRSSPMSRSALREAPHTPICARTARQQPMILFQNCAQDRS